jgi:hypothetical protein
VKDLTVSPTKQSFSQLLKEKLTVFKAYFKESDSKDELLIFLLVINIMLVLFLFDFYIQEF